MKLRRLDLVAWGHFQGLSIALREGALNVIYGPNEAGKSTARRAVTALLYGVPRGTPDAFALAKATDVRIGGEVFDEHRALAFVRRGGVKNTVLAPSGEPLPDEALASLRGGVSEATFTSVFSMDHDSLREGADAVLRGGGELGESLAAAALGSARLSVAVRTLEERELELYNSAPNAKKSKLHEALRAHRDQKLRLGAAESSPEAYAAQRTALAEMRAAHAKAREGAELARSERQRLEEIELARPVVLAKLALERELAELADVPALRKGLEAELATHLATRAQAETRLETVEHARLVARERARARGDVPAFYTEPSRRARAERDLATLRREVVVAETREARRAELAKAADARRATLGAARLALGKLGEDEHAVREVIGKRAAFVRLADEARAAKAAFDQASRKSTELSQVAEAASTSSGRAQALEAELSPLETALALEPRAVLVLRETDAAARAVRALEVELHVSTSALFDAPLGPERILALDLPSRESIEVADRARTKLEAKLEKLAQEAETIATRVRTVRVELAAQRTAFMPATDTELAEARRARDVALDALRGEKPGEASSTSFDAVAGLVREADALADRMRREADRVLAFARLVEEEESLVARAREIELEGTKAHEAIVAAGADELARAKAAGARITSARELSSFRAKVEPLAERARDLAAKRAALAAHESEAAVLAQAFGRALEKSGRKGLGALSLDEARAKLLARRDEIRTDIAVLRAQEENDARKLEELRTSEAELRATRLAYDEARAAARGPLELLSLLPDAPGKEVIERFEALGALVRELDACADLARETAALDAELTSFAAEVARIEGDLAVVGVDDGATFVQRAHRLVAELAAAQKVAEEAKDADDAEKELAREAETLTATLDASNRRLRELYEAAGATDETSFVSRVRRAEHKLDLETRLALREEELGRLARTCSKAELVAKVTDGSVDTVREMAALDAEIERLELEGRRALEDAARTEQGLAQYHTQDLGAASAAEDLEMGLAEMEKLAESWLATRAARRLVERKMRRYREENQGPVLERASRHFRTLTSNAYEAVTAELGRDDTVTLHAKRADGRSLDPSELSDGTRDQLYLALRVASLERLGASGTRAPVIVDDALVHFDDDRARAALVVLAELAKTHTVVFFTHHHRVVELAESALTSDSLETVSLSKSRTS